MASLTEEILNQCLMQHAASQYVQGGAPAQLPPPYPSEPTQSSATSGGGSITSSLRQWRKKDHIDKQQQQQQAAAEQPAIVANSTNGSPQNVPRSSSNMAAYYPRPGNDLCHYPPQFPPEYSVYKPPPPAPVKYSEIVESAPGNHQRLEHFAQVITKHKDKEYLGLCPPPMKPQYAEPAKAPYADQYLHKEPQMKAYNMPAAMQMQRDQYPQYLPKYNAQAQYPSHQYNHQEPNTFLAQLSQLNPRLAHSIMNEHRIREQQLPPPLYPGLEQPPSRAYHSHPQRVYPPPPSASSLHGAPSHSSHRNLHQTYNYNQPYQVVKPSPIQSPMDQYGRLPQYPPPGMSKYYPSLDQPMRNASPSQRSYAETFGYPQQAPKMSPPFPSQCAVGQMEYAQHYQHRRSHEYYNQAYKSGYQQSSPHEDESGSDKRALKQFFEKFAEENLTGTGSEFVTSANGEEALYVLDSTEIPSENLPQYLHLQQVEKLPMNVRGIYHTVMPSSGNRHIIITPERPSLEHHQPTSGVLSYGHRPPSHQMEEHRASQLMEACFENKVVQLHIVENGTTRSEGNPNPTESVIVQSNPCLVRGEHYNVVMNDANYIVKKHMINIVEDLDAIGGGDSSQHTKSMPIIEDSAEEHMSSIFQEMENIHRESVLRQEKNSLEQTPEDLTVNDKHKSGFETLKEPEPSKVVTTTREDDAAVNLSHSKHQPELPPPSPPPPPPPEEVTREKLAKPEASPKQTIDVVEEIEQFLKDVSSDIPRDETIASRADILEQSDKDFIHTCRASAAQELGSLDSTLISQDEEPAKVAGLASASPIGNEEEATKEEAERIETVAKIAGFEVNRPKSADTQTPPSEETLKSSKDGQATNMTDGTELLDENHLTPPSSPLQETIEMPPLEKETRTIGDKDATEDRPSFPGEAVANHEETLPNEASGDIDEETGEEDSKSPVASLPPEHEIEEDRSNGPKTPPAEDCSPRVSEEIPAEDKTSGNEQETESSPKNNNENLEPDPRGKNKEEQETASVENEETVEIEPATVPSAATQEPSLPENDETVEDYRENDDESEDLPLHEHRGLISEDSATEEIACASEEEGEQREDSKDAGEDRQQLVAADEDFVNNNSVPTEHRNDKETDTPYYPKSDESCACDQDDEDHILNDDPADDAPSEWAEEDTLLSPSSATSEDKANTETDSTNGFDKSRVIKVSCAEIVEDLDDRSSAILIEGAKEDEIQTEEDVSDESPKREIVAGASTVQEPNMADPNASSMGEEESDAAVVEELNATTVEESQESGVLDVAKIPSQSEDITYQHSPTPEEQTDPMTVEESNTRVQDSGVLEITTIPSQPEDRSHQNSPAPEEQQSNAITAEDESDTRVQESSRVLETVKIPSHSEDITHRHSPTPEEQSGAITVEESDTSGQESPVLEIAKVPSQSEDIPHQHSPTPEEQSIPTTVQESGVLEITKIPSQPGDRGRQNSSTPEEQQSNAITVEDESDTIVQKSRVLEITQAPAQPEDIPGQHPPTPKEQSNPTTVEESNTTVQESGVLEITKIPSEPEGRGRQNSSIPNEEQFIDVAVEESDTVVQERLEITKTTSQSDISRQNSSTSEDQQCNAITVEESDASVQESGLLESEDIPHQHSPTPEEQTNPMTVEESRIQESGVLEITIPSQPENSTTPEEQQSDATTVEESDTSVGESDVLEITNIPSQSVHQNSSTSEEEQSNGITVQESTKTPCQPEDRSHPNPSTPEEDAMTVEESDTAVQEPTDVTHENSPTAEKEQLTIEVSQPPERERSESSQVNFCQTQQLVEDTSSTVQRNSPIVKPPPGIDDTQALDEEVASLTKRFSSNRKPKRHHRPQISPKLKTEIATNFSSKSPDVLEVDLKPQFPTIVIEDSDGEEQSIKQEAGEEEPKIVVVPSSVPRTEADDPSVFYQVQDPNVLLQIGDQWLQINVTQQLGKRVIQLKPLPARVVQLSSEDVPPVLQEVEVKDQDSAVNDDDQMPTLTREDYVLPDDVNVMNEEIVSSSTGKGSRSNTANETKEAEQEKPEKGEMGKTKGLKGEKPQKQLKTKAALKYVEPPKTEQTKKIPPKKAERTGKVARKATSADLKVASDKSDGSKSLASKPEKVRRKKLQVITEKKVVKFQMPGELIDISEAVKLKHQEKKVKDQNSKKVEKVKKSEKTVSKDKFRIPVKGQNSLAVKPLQNSNSDKQDKPKQLEIKKRPCTKKRPNPAPADVGFSTKKPRSEAVHSVTDKTAPTEKPKLETEPLKTESVQENSVTSSTCQENEPKKANSDDWENDDDLKTMNRKRKLSLEEYKRKHRNATPDDLPPREDLTNDLLQPLTPKTSSTVSPINFQIQTGMRTYSRISRNTEVLSNESLTNGIQLNLPKFKTDQARATNSPLHIRKLIQRLYDHEKLTEGELRSLHAIISYKRLHQQLNAKPKGRGPPGVVVRKIPAKRKLRKRFRNLYSDEETDLETTASSSRRKSSVPDDREDEMSDYSVVQPNATQEPLKLVLKRSSLKSNALLHKEAYVRLERSPLVERRLREFLLEDLI